MTKMYVNTEILDRQMTFLNTLIQLTGSGISCHKEINAVLDSIAKGLDIYDKDGTVDLISHANGHPTISWNSTLNCPVIVDSGYDNKDGTQGRNCVTVKEVLNDLARGLTVHQIAGNYDLNINQVQGAVIYAAHVMNDDGRNYTS